MIIDQHTALYGVIGNPVRHSLSPALHNTALSAAGLNAVYLAFEINDIEECVKGIRALGIRGTSITLPFKTAVIPFLDEIDPLAKRIGAVNTIVNDNGRLKGYNTDALGALKALEEKIRLPGMTCFVIGAGGAARAIGFMLKERGATLSIVNRSRKHGQELARFLECRYVPMENLEAEKADILVQTTPVGMYPDVGQCPVPKSILKKGMVVMDIIYNPFETELIKVSGTLGCVTINGLHMFIHQGAEQFNLWTGINPPLAVMQHAVKEVLLKKDEKH